MLVALFALRPKRVHEYNKNHIVAFGRHYCAKRGHEVGAELA